jgi:hypothetical protein
VEVLGGSIVGFVMKFRPKVVVAEMFDAGAGTFFGDGSELVCGLFRCWGGWCAGDVCNFWEEMSEWL